MNPCEHCAIDDKIYECCGRHPETGEAADLPISSDQKRNACPHLSKTGQCRIYDHRPLACRTHYCARYQGLNGMAAGFAAMRELYENMKR